MNRNLGSNPITETSKKEPAMQIDEYTKHDAVGLAELIRAGEVSSAEVQDAAARALDQVEPALSAIVGERYAQPLDHDADGVFAGVPFAIKDLVIHADGVPTRNGTRMLGEGVVLGESALMTRFRKAGLAAMATTRTPEFGFNATTEAIAYGAPTKNPWDTTRSPGGSSGGSAALVAARALPVAHANDGGGSIRIPASACGLVGLKPSRGRVTVGPGYGDPLLGLGVEFALSRSVRDTATMLDAVHGSEPGERYLLPEPALSFSESAKRGAERKRIAIAWDLLTPGQQMDPQVRAAVEETAALLESMGHIVEIASPQIDHEEWLDASYKLWATFLADGVQTLSGLLGIEASSEVLEHVTLRCVEYGENVTGVDLMRTEGTMNRASRALGEFHTEYDLTLSATMMSPTFPLGHFDQNDPALDAQGWFEKLFSGLGTALFNATGTPGISVPLAQSAEGWPIGIQLGAAYGDEATLIALAADLERARPWADRRPGVVAGGE